MPVSWSVNCHTSRNVPEVGRRADEEVEVVRLALHVMKPGDGEQDEHGVGVVVRRVAGSEG